MLRLFDRFEGFTDRLVDDICVLFGSWVICAQLVVFAGGTLFHLVALFLLVLPVLIAFWRRARRSAPGPMAAVSRSRRHPRGGFSTVRESAAIVMALLACAAFFDGRPIAAWWLVAVAAMLGAMGFLGASRIRVWPVRAGRRRELALCGLALTIGLVALFGHRVNFDDSLYVHAAVAAVDRPDVALLSEDTMHGLQGVSVDLPAHKVRAFELLNGAVALVAGMPPIRVFHLLVPFVAALLIPLAWAKLFRLIAPRYWLVATLITMAVYLGVGEANRWYSNFSVVRIWQGKSIFLSAMVPAIYAFGIEFAVKPTRRRALLLFAAQSAAVGLTSSALWAAPAAAGLGLVTGAGRARRGLWVVPLGMLSSAFVFVMAIVVRVDLSRMARGMRRPGAFDPGASLSEALALVMGDGRLLGFCIVVLGCGWVFSHRGSMARRFAVVTSCVPVLIMLNPYASVWIRSGITGPDYWRALWTIPLPALIALVLASPLRGGARAAARDAGTTRRAGGIGHVSVRWRAPLVVVVTSAFLAWAPTYSAIGDGNKVVWQTPALRVDAEGYELARRINDAVPEGSYVVAPTIANRWIPTFERHAHSLRVRDYLTLPLRKQDARLWMVEFADGSVRSPERLAFFERGLTEFTVRGVCLRTEQDMRAIHDVLEGRGFSRTYAGAEWEIWVREHAWWR